MAKVTLSDHQWTLLTGSAATNVKFQNVGRCNIRIAYTNGAATPPAGYEGDEYDSVDRLGEGLQALANLTTVSGADRVWGLALGADGAVNVEFN